MKDKKEFLTGLAVRIAKGELGLSDSIPEEELSRILMSNNFSLSDLMLLDELVQAIIEEEQKNER